MHSTQSSIWKSQFKTKLGKHVTYTSILIQVLLITHTFASTNSPDLCKTYKYAFHNKTNGKQKILWQKCRRYDVSACQLSDESWDGISKFTVIYVHWSKGEKQQWSQWDNGRRTATQSTDISLQWYWKAGGKHNTLVINTGLNASQRTGDNEWIANITSLNQLVEDKE